MYVCLFFALRFWLLSGAIDLVLLGVLCFFFLFLCQSVFFLSIRFIFFFCVFFFFSFICLSFFFFFVCLVGIDCTFINFFFFLVV